MCRISRSRAVRSGSSRDGYEIDAKASGNPGHAQMMLMLQSLLADRFQLRVHRESREMPVYALAPARGGLKLPPPRDGSCVAEQGAASRAEGIPPRAEMWGDGRAGGSRETGTYGAAKCRWPSSCAAVRDARASGDGSDGILPGYSMWIWSSGADDAIGGFSSAAGGCPGRDREPFDLQRGPAAGAPVRIDQRAGRSARH